METSSTKDCECHVDNPQSPNRAIHYCPLHDAARDLYAAAKFARSVLAANPMELSERMAIEKLDAALLLAKGPDTSEQKGTY